jgi:hypothetical protein
MVMRIWRSTTPDALRLAAVVASVEGAVVVRLDRFPSMPSDQASEVGHGPAPLIESLGVTTRVLSTDCSCSNRV